VGHTHIVEAGPTLDGGAVKQEFSIARRQAEAGIGFEIRVHGGKGIVEMSSVKKNVPGKGVGIEISRTGGVEIPEISHIAKGGIGEVRRVPHREIIEMGLTAKGT
jgi:hypothetical protein